MKVLITGGAGFLGLHLARHFSKKKHQVSLLDIANFPDEEYKGNFKLINADVRNDKAVEKAVAGQDVVIHAAAALPLWTREEIISTNVQGTANILKAAKKSKIQRVIYISSTAVYGVPEKHPIEESDPVLGVGAYGESKIAAEAKCFEALADGLNVTILRPKTFVGTERLGVFEILFDWIHDGKQIPMIGDGSNRYQLLDVDDLVEAIYLISKSKAKKLNGAFNIGAGKFETIAQDLDKLFKAANSGSSLKPIPAWLVKPALRLAEKTGLSPLYQWVYETADKDSFVSIDKLTQALNWQPKYSNAQALIKSFKWYQEHYVEVKSRQSGVTHTVGWKQGILGLAKRFF